MLAAHVHQARARQIQILGARLQRLRGVTKIVGLQTQIRIQPRPGRVFRAPQSSQDREGFLVAALLSSDAGRAYLLLDAATGDLA